MQCFSNSKSRLMLTGSIAFLVLSMVGKAGASIIYVDDDVRGGNVGSSWEHAINSLQDALLLAYFSVEPVEIRVAQGTYTPDHGIGIMPGNREASFQLMSNVTIKGGYAGSGTRDPDARDTNRYTSILSGDLNSNDNPRRTNKDENSYHVVKANGTDVTAVLDGFTITGGNADGPPPHDNGGGMYNDDSNPTLINCIFSGNNASSGGGMYVINSHPMLVDCIFNENSTSQNGGGMQNNNSNPTLINCIFTNNSATRSGGGMYNDNSSPTSTNCTFIGNAGGSDGGGGMYNMNSAIMLAGCTFSENMTEGNGGGIHNHNSDAELLNCKFRANSSRVSGGGIFSDSRSELNLTNCIFSRNYALTGGGLENIGSSNSTLYNCTFSGNSAEAAGGGLSNRREGGSLTLTNCILWGDTPDEISGWAYASYSNIENVSHNWNVSISDNSEGIIDIDPLFADTDNGDYHLKSQAGRWDPTIESWVIDEVSSPCIDAGDPESSVGLEYFPNGGRINMGAYGGTPQASLSPWHLQLSPSQASDPYPPDRAIDVDTNVTLSWTPGLNAISHNVYFGTNIPPLFVGNQIGAEFDPGILDYGQTYFWRVDELLSEGEIITGAVWTFTTTDTRPPKGRGSCFLAETPVWINGVLVPISKADIEQTICRVNVIGKIHEVQEHQGTFVCYDVVLQSGNCISVAEYHCFLEESGRWISLQELKAGTKLQTSNGLIEIISVTKRPMPYVGKVYNLKIEGSDRYLVGEDAIIVRDY